MQTFSLSGRFHYSIEAQPSPFTCRAELQSLEPDLEIIHLVLDAPQEGALPAVSISWQVPHRDIQCLWRPDGATQSFPCVWNGYSQTDAIHSAPVYCLLSSSGQNRMTAAFSAAADNISSRLALREEDASWQMEVRLFETPRAALNHYELSIMVDCRDIHYEQALRNVSRWWAGMDTYIPRAIPEDSRLPAYSTWYSYHQQPDAGSIEREARLAAALGMRVMILDDGWQMEDASRTYDYCGDWQPYPGAFPDMRAHVDKIHASGMQFMLWLALPFVGPHSAAYTRFAQKTLPPVGGVGVLDPRYPDVRQYLIETCERAVGRWGADGLKLDFIDSFHQPESESPSAAPGRDYESVNEATLKLLDDLYSRLAGIRPDIHIEFRQPYTGPAMLRTASMLRASDCPGDFVQNKVRTVNLRLLSGETSVHSDMLLWHPTDPAEAVALQLIHVLFSVPQISVRLAELPPAQRAALSFWLEFWLEHRSLLLGGQLRAAHPELGYTCVTSHLNDEWIAAAYCEEVIDLPDDVKHIYLVNASNRPGIVCRAVSSGAYRVSIKDCVGAPISGGESQVNGNIFDLPIPVSGLAELVRA